MDRSYSIAPMMGRTDSQFRYLIRLISKKTVLFTEMIHSNAILYGNKNKLEEYSNIENPIVLQLGGNDPKNLGKVSKIANKFNYDEINLNLGCPSPRVSSGGFGAALMNDPELVKDCLLSIKENFNKEVSVKIRLGTDDNDIDKTLDDFVDSIQSCNIKVFYVHARKAILKGLTPKQNREIPPLNYERVRKLKEDFSDLEIIINGGIKQLDFLKKNDLSSLEGIMIGREAYSNPLIFSKVDKILEARLIKDNSLYDITSEMFNYFETIKNINLVRRGLIHMHGLFNGHKEAKKIRILLSNIIYLEKSKYEILSILEKDIIRAA
ncbi:MAG: tRNA dihydrouridine(20/20a) synthase DusA [Gammaproteobacteria bacterium]|nr:MAG: tRNA dihydrouridine(20/20a) synthase DusA [Gammaproteobacteria bacterium]|tara:strand:- start:6008 stop:6976 length:969 start_codon:yes stop_codon:yes gene_type:complete